MPNTETTALKLKAHGHGHHPPPVAMPSGGGLSSGEKEHCGNCSVRAAFNVVVLLMVFFSSYTDRIGFWTLVGHATRWAGGDLLSGRAAALYTGVSQGIGWKRTGFMG